MSGVFPSADYCFDVYVTAKRRRPRLIDFNPWGGATLPLLFDWDELSRPKDADSDDDSDADADAGAGGGGGGDGGAAAAAGEAADGSGTNGRSCGKTAETRHPQSMTM